MRIGESKNTSFKRLAANRTNNVVRNLRLLGNLSNKNNYAYTENDYKKIFNMVENELRLAKSRFLVALNKKSKFKI